MIGVVLSGGGTKGAFQAGVIQRLGIKPDLVVGTSIGAINAMIWNFKGQDELAKYWHDVDSRSKWLSLNWRGLFLDGIFTARGLERFLKHISDSGTPRFKSYACRVNINDGMIDYVRHDSIEYVDSVIDSATVPVIIKPMRCYVDGGVREKIPLQFAIEAGCKEIHVIMCNPIYKNPEIAKMPKNPVAMVMRTIDILTHEGQNDDVKRSSLEENITLTFYAPNRHLYETFCFDGRLIKGAFKLGLEAQGVSAKELSYRLS